MSNNNSKKALKTIAILLSVILLFTAAAIYGVFKKETDIDANFTQQYLDRNGIKITEFYGTSRFNEIESAIQAERNSYWKKMYTLPVIFSLVSLAAAAGAFLVGKKNKFNLPGLIDCFVAGFSSLFMFVASLIRLITADYKYLFLTSESGTWLGIGTLGWILAAASLISVVAAFFLAKSGNAAVKQKNDKKAKGAVKKAPTDDGEDDEIVVMEEESNEETENDDNDESDEEYENDDNDESDEEIDADDDDAE